jgi:signal transduction histidine kinase
MVVAPLRCGTEVLGVLAIDFAEPRHLPEDLVLLVDAIARSSALAVANTWASTRLMERAAGLQSLLEATRGLSSTASLREVAEIVSASIEELLGARHLSVHLVDETGGRYRLLLQRGMELPIEGEVGRLPRRIVQQVSTAWAASEWPGPVVLEDIRRLTGLSAASLGTVETAIVLPLVGRNGTVFGVVTVGLEGLAPPSRASLDLSGALAAHIAFAVERTALVERVALGGQFANALLELNELHHDAPDGLLAGLREAVPTAVGFRIAGMRLATENGVVEAGEWSASTFERQLWGPWRRRRTRPELVEHEGSVYAPVWVDGRVIGVVRAEPLEGSLAEHERQLLETLATAIGDAARRQQLGRDIERRDRELAVAEERAQFAWDLHETVAGFLRAIEITADNLVESTAGKALDDAKLVAALTRSGRRELEEAVRAAAPLAFDARGLGETVRGTVRGLGDLLGADADLSVRGTSRPLPVDIQQLLLRIVFETLYRVERNGRASGVAVRLEFGEKEVAVVIRDDGVDLQGREGADGVPSAHFGLRMVRRRVEEAGGQLTVEHCPPRGLMLRATVPA